ncbi:MAG: hypothetical protein JOZ80_05225 [Acidobacteriaceae bacterium]|nr:hypothetical protein [Acidobacteriaceae bacterium]
MSRWIAFDRDTAEAIRQLFGDDPAELRSGDPLKAALQLSKPCVAILPSSTPGKALLAHFRPGVPAVVHLSYEPTGFLGLSDTPIFEEEVQPAVPKKHWWQRKRAS